MAYEGRGSHWWESLGEQLSVCKSVGVLVASRGVWRRGRGCERREQHERGECCWEGREGDHRVGLVRRPERYEYESTKERDRRRAFFISRLGAPKTKVAKSAELRSFQPIGRRRPRKRGSL